MSRTRLALAQMRERVVEENRRAAEAGDADFECHARAQRGLLENQRKEFVRRARCDSAPGEP